MTTEPEALRLAREIVGLDDRLGSRMLSSERGPARVARALISALAVVEAARQEWFSNDYHSRVQAAIRAHDAILSPASTRPADVSMDGGNTDGSAGGRKEDENAT